LLGDEEELMERRRKESEEAWWAWDGVEDENDVKKRTQK